jgi:hypothetical protein
MVGILLNGIVYTTAWQLSALKHVYSYGLVHRDINQTTSYYVLDMIGTFV